VFEFDPELMVQDLVALIGSGAIIVDDGLEAAIRKELGLPEAEYKHEDPAMIRQQMLDVAKTSAEGNAPPSNGAKSSSPKGKAQ
jgi:hypothetical protein